MRIAFTLLASLALLSAGCGGIPVQTYSGKQRDPAQIARVHETDQLRITSVDEKKYLDISPTHPIAGESMQHAPHVFELEPGSHRIAVQFLGFVNGRFACGDNLVTFLYNFEAAKDYSFALKTIHMPERPDSNDRHVEGTWHTVLIDQPTGNQLAMSEGGPPAMRTPGAVGSYVPLPPPGSISNNGATVTGLAMIRGRSGTVYNAAGRDVLIVPESPDVTQWILTRVSYQANGNFVNPPADPKIFKTEARRTLGYGRGQFEFDNVLPGTYIVIFDMGPAEFIGRARVNIAPGQAHVDGVMAIAGTFTNLSR